MNHEVELAKKLLEGKGYSVSQKLKESAETHPGWEYSEHNGRGPWTANQYIKEYNDELYLMIYPPQAVPGEDYLDEWHAEIQGIHQGTSLDSYETGFKSFAEAEAWINSQIEKYDPEGEQSARDEKSLQSVLGRFEEVINSVNRMPDYLKDDFKESAMRILQSL